MLARARTAPGEVIALVLGVRDELTREAPPPRGLAGRVDQMLLSVGAQATRRTSGGRGENRAGHVLLELLRIAPDPVLTVRASGRVGLWVGNGSPGDFAALSVTPASE